MEMPGTQIIPDETTVEEPDMPMTGNRNIYMFSEIWGDLVEDTVCQLLCLAAESDDDINLIINSPGGSVTDTVSIIDAMDTIKAKVNTFVIGEAASAAAIIAVNGAKRFVSANSKIMIHQASGGTFGQIDDMKADIMTMEQLNDFLFNTLAKNTHMTAQEWKSKIGTNDVYYSAQEAVSAGLCDAVMTTDIMKTYKLSETIDAGQGDEIDMSENKLSRVPLLKVGAFKHPVTGKNITITLEELKQLKANFENNVRGIGISIDQTHDNDSGEKPARAWIKELIIENDRLDAMAEFTKEGRELVAQNTFKYASAEFSTMYTDEQGMSHPYVLLGATLTNRPVIKNEAIKLSEKGGSPNMELGELTKVLKAKHSIDLTALQAQAEEATQLKAQVGTLQTVNATLETEVKSLKEETVKADKEKSYDGLLKAGKVTPAQKEKLFSTFALAADMVEFYKDAQPVVALNHREGDNTSETDLTDTEKKLVDEGKVTKEAVLASKKLK